MDVEWVMEPFALDGLIFVVSAENPVGSLTAEQVRKLYTGEITNWKDVGGADEPVAAFQRNAEAGSQTMMKKLVMDGLELAQPPTERVVETMYGLMEAVRGFDGSAGAIGYSVYYYANDMRMAEGLKILQIDGVDPAPETFRDGSYPFTSPYYVLRRSGQQAPEGANVLFDWMLSAEGQRLVSAMGYAAVNPEGREAVRVAADWTRLPRQESQGERITRRTAERVEKLTPAGDYGVLVPFLGEELMVGTDLYDGMGWSHYRFGLADGQGRIVVDPVYDGIRVASFENSVGADDLPVYILSQVDPAQGQYGTVLYGLAALDGSWCTDVTYVMAAAIEKDEFVLIDRDGMAWLCDLEGHLKNCGFSRPLLAPYGGFWDDMMPRVSAPLAEMGFGEDRCLLNFHTGQILSPPADLDSCVNWRYCGGGLMPARSQKGPYGYLDSSGNWALPPAYIDAYGFIGNYAQVDLGGRSCIIDRQGRAALTPSGALRQTWCSGRVYYLDIDYIDHTIHAIYNAALEPVDLPAVGCVPEETSANLSWYDQAGQGWHWDGEIIQAIPDGLLPHSARHGALQILCSEDDRCGLYDYDREAWVLPMSDHRIEAVADVVTGEACWMQMLDDEHFTVYNSDGQAIAISKPPLIGYNSLRVNGLLPVRDDRWSGIVDETGQWLLRIALPADE